MGTEKHTGAAASALKRLGAAALATLLLTMSAFAFTVEREYTLTVGDTELSGSVELLMAAVEETEARVQDITGEEYSLEYVLTGSVGFSFARQNDILSAPDGARCLMAELDAVKQALAVSVNGGKLFASEDISGLGQALYEHLHRFDSWNTTGSAFAENVELSVEYVASDLLKSLEDIRTYLNSGDCRVAVVTRCESVESAAIPCSTVYKDEPTLYLGETATAFEGSDGVLSRRYGVTLVNGRETGRELLEEQVATPAADRVVLQGTKELPPYVSKGVYAWPAQGVITSYFGYRNVSVGSSNHKGIDVAASTGTDILAADGGEVIYAGNGMSGYGNLVQIRHDNGDVSYYAHCSRLFVAVGDKVAQGQLIAAMGSTGVSTGSHLHFEIRVDGEAVNPLDKLPER